jgi:hypothetical protein
VGRGIPGRMEKRVVSTAGAEEKNRSKENEGG